MSAFGPFIMDLYLPSLPELQAYFNTSASFTQVSLMTAMIGLGFGQLLIGPISDKYGRKTPLLVSLAIYTLSSFALIFSPNIHVLITLRGIQGLSAAGAVVSSRAIATDLYSGKELGRFFAMLMTVHGIAPVISPMVGSALLTFTDWHGVFVVLTALGCVLILAVSRFYESLPVERRINRSILQTFKIYPKILANRTFMGFISMQAFGFGGMFGYISASPFIFQSNFGLSPLAFGLCFGANGLAVMTGANVSQRVDRRKALAFGAFLYFAATWYVAFALNTGLGFWFVEPAFFAMMLSLGCIFPTVSMQAMASERQNAGSASAMLGFCPFLLGAIVSPLVGVGNIFLSTSIALCISSLLVVLMYFKVRGKLVFQ